MSSKRYRQRRRNRRKRRRSHKHLIPADVENDTSRQRGWLAGLRVKTIKRYHRLKPKD